MKYSLSEFQVILKLLFINWNDPLDQLGELIGKLWRKCSWTWTWAVLTLEFFPVLKWGCYFILKLNISYTPFELHLKVGNGKLPLEVWKLCNLVFLLLSCRERLYACCCKVWYFISCFHPRCWSIKQNLIECRKSFVINEGVTFTEHEIIWSWLILLRRLQWEEIQSSFPVSGIASSFLDMVSWMNLHLNKIYIRQRMCVKTKFFGLNVSNRVILKWGRKRVEANHVCFHDEGYGVALGSERGVRPASFVY